MFPNTLRILITFVTATDVQAILAAFNVSLNNEWGLLNQFPPFRYFISVFTIVKTLVT